MASRSADPRPKIGLALAGGGPEGAVYEIGALRALEEALGGLDCNDLGVYVGVSAGAFVCANLANQITTTQMVRGIVREDGQPFELQNFFVPALGEFVQRGLMLPGLAVRAVCDRLTAAAGLQADPTAAPRNVLSALQGALPVALFDNEPIRRYLRDVFTRPGRSDDFRTLSRRLFVVAAQLDSGEAVCFGAPGFDHVPISTAIEASAALPGLYPPVRIEGRDYVDGVLLKTMHASVALEHGAELVLGINPIVPVDTARAVAEGHPEYRTLRELGFAAVASQTLRTLIHSRLAVGIKAYEERFPGRDVVLFEPQRDDFLMFFTNIFSFAARRFVADLAYRSTRRDLLRRHDTLAPLFARHGLTLRKDVLLDAERSLWADADLGPPAGREPVTQTLGRVLDRLDALVADEARD